MNRLLIIDGMNLVRRLYAAQPDEQDLAGLAQRTLNACHKLCAYHHPSHLAIVWDGEQESWRKKLYGDYKKGRKPMPPLLAQYLPQLKQALATAGMLSVNADAEADDVIATLACKVCQHAGEAIIVSTDKGFFQLQFKGLQQWDHFAQRWMDVASLEQKLGINRQQLLDFIALSGDSGNRIPGIPGIGPKSAAELLKSFRSLANIYHALDTLGHKQAEKLRSGYDMARLSYRLAKLQTDMTLNLNLSDYRWQPKEATAEPS
ncbi:flap endonuclease Xni [Shewanella sp. YIC-542]|uniref:flap endonuclease Xni n=1 Tax=Shewanella mytili TaxID=3377111 RepID=UPI00398F6012